MAGRIYSLTLLVSLVFLVTPVAAFGAGDIPREHGLGMYVWRHGDISQLLLSLPVSFATKYAFTELEKRQVYFGNWLRDMSQVVDTAMLENMSEELLRAVVTILAFMHFGFATDEFDVTKERLGCYKHIEHIDNPKGYPDNAKDCDDRLRGPVRDEELEIDLETGMKNYIAKSGMGWDTSADYIRTQLELAISKGRDGRKYDDQVAMADAFRHLGGALHTLEDFSAHSNFIELCLTKFGVDGIYAFVGDACRIDTPRPGIQVPPLVTGTFGMLDALQSIVGEVDDRAIMVTKGELGALEDMMDVGGMAFDGIYSILKGSMSLLSSMSTNGETLLSDLNKVNDTVKEAQKDPSKYKLSGQNNGPSPIWEAIEPAFRLHDSVAKWILDRKDWFANEALSRAAAQVGKYIDAFVYKTLSIIIEPLIKQMRNAVKEGRVTLLEEEKKTSEMSNDENKKSEHVLVKGSNDSNPSHSLIAKDHFSNVLNPPAGLIATVVTNWTTQQIVQCWDNPSKDAERTIQDILSILHHPYFTDGEQFIQTAMSECVKSWWESHDEKEQAQLQQKLSKEGVEKDLNNDHHLTEAYFTGKRRGFADFEDSWPQVVVKPSKELGAAQLVSEVANQMSSIASTIQSEAVKAVTNVGAAAGLISSGKPVNDETETGEKSIKDEAALEKTIGRKPSPEILALFHGWQQNKVSNDDFMAVLARQTEIATQDAEENSQAQ